MSLFDWILGRKLEPIDDDSCESERGRIRDRLSKLGWIDHRGQVTAPIYLQYDEITPEIITKIRLVVGHDKAYEIPMSDEERANIAFLLSLVSKENYSTFVPSGVGD